MNSSAYPLSVADLGPTWESIAPSVKARVASRRQKELASRLGVSEGGLSNYLSGTREPSISAIAAMADFFGVSVDTLLGRETGSPQPVVGRTSDRGGRELHGVGAPLVAIDVAAGDGALTEVSDDRVYFFGQRYMSTHGWTERSKDRFCCIKLGSASVAESMEPTIPHGSLLLVDRRPAWERLHSKAREIYLVRMPGEREAVKRCTLVGEQLVLESDNPAPKHHPKTFSVTGENWRDFVRGRVLWWSVEA